MTYEEAKKNVIYGRFTAETKNKIYEALEKQIPKKPLPDNRYYEKGRCPNCNAIFIDMSTNYCINCGQALDWSRKMDK